MESPDRRNALGKLVIILRKATRLVQLIPFVYLFFYAIYMFLSTVASDDTLYFMDNIFLVRPVTMFGMLLASRIFNMCIWHKIACVLPGTSQIENYIDNYVITFTQEEIILINIFIGLIALAFLVLTYKHFAYGR